MSVNNIVIRPSGSPIDTSVTEPRQPAGAHPPPLLRTVNDRLGWAQPIVHSSPKAGGGGDGYVTAVPKSLPMPYVTAADATTIDSWRSAPCAAGRPLDRLTKL